MALDKHFHKAEEKPRVIRNSILHKCEELSPRKLGKDIKVAEAEVLHEFVVNTNKHGCPFRAIVSEHNSWQ